MKSKRSPRFRLILSVVIVVLVIVSFFFITPYYRLLTQTVKVSPFKALMGIGGPESLNGTVNILLLGVPGGNHDGPNLSDSINVLSYDMKTNRLTTIGIPRDVWSETIHQKINAAYATGEAIEPGRGMTLARAEVSGIIGIPIHYAAVIRFAQFEQLIDYLEGVDVDVEKAFTDTEFPVTGKEDDTCGGDLDFKCRYETISFKKGVQHMNGATALKYVRSRHATGEEGSDFSRNMRQQTVMRALRQKLLSPSIVFHPHKIEGLYKTLDKLVERDITNQQAAVIAKTIATKRNFAQFSGVLPRDLFVVPDAWQYDGQYVLVPMSGNFQAVHEYIDKLLKEKDFSEDK